MTSEEVLEQMIEEEILCNYCSCKRICTHTMPFSCDIEDLEEIIDYLSYCEDRAIESELEE